MINLYNSKIINIKQQTLEMPHVSKMNIRIYSELNGNKNTLYQNLKNTVRMVFRKILIALNPCMGKKTMS